MAVEIPHFAFPFERLPNGRVATVEQDTAAHIMACEDVITYCPLGARPERPEFGWRWPYMAQIPIDVSDLLAAQKRFEPRGNPTQVERTTQVAQEALGIVDLDVDIEIPTGD